MKNREKFREEIVEAIKEESNENNGKLCCFLKDNVIPRFISEEDMNMKICGGVDCHTCAKMFAFWLDEECTECWKYCELVEDKEGITEIEFKTNSPQEPEQWWIFTFGYGQEHAGYYVKVYGTFGGARDKMFEKYGDKWAFQYSAVEWDELSKDKNPMWCMEKELEVIE